MASIGCKGPALARFPLSPPAGGQLPREGGEPRALRATSPRQGGGGAADSFPQGVPSRKDSHCQRRADVL